ncbi:GNAT family N-acetyltransferase [Niallia circulans]|uniref:GNAT family N-acetyltransferase n=1 Tax=Niallia circulans TaxID=1397 RepID=A0A941JRM8_NIACI|nr:GNAT family N-acetyltransferase [Niallia circulans]MCB5238575.1 GNAT family N-acetyltransferase [Niallia circulans]
MIIIRKMKKSDINSVRKIAAVTWKNTYSEFIPEVIQEKVLNDAYSDEEMNKRFISSLNLIAEYNDEITGYAFFSGDLSRKEIYLESLYIHPNFQGKGIGKQLLNSGIKKYSDPSTISLSVYKGNSNLFFYKKEGFKITKENTGNFYGHPMTFMVMTKEIAKS